jgi:phosphatidylserine/phosphatidylglycerophosphate/cardiolipin synthase-like enzyme
MENIDIIKSPWQDIFINLLKSSKKEIYLASPFIKEQIAEIVANNTSKNIDIKYINSFKLSYFHRGVSDLSALGIFNNHLVEQKSVHNLHAKLFIFDEQAIITSGNLTAGGLKNNFEYGVLLKGEIVKNIKKDYLSLFNNQDYPEITIDIINKAENILSSVPKEKQRKLEIENINIFKETISNENSVEKYDGGVESIILNLKLWEKDVFICLLQISKDVFSLQDVYDFEEYLQIIHPNNNNIKPKIRQQLQYLRDIGLLEFIGGGIYKKLWSQSK